MSKKDDDDISMFPLETENDTDYEDFSPLFRRPVSNKDHCDPEVLLEIEN
jgi:hypothetical protein